MRGIRKDETGKRFGMLVAIEPVYQEKGGWCWRCKCDCGNETIVRRCSLTNGTKSCGCLRIRGSQAHTKHRRSNTRLYAVWANIKQRCNNPKSQEYKNYGGRGIRMCQEWQNDFEAFYKWAVANGYDENAKRGECTIDRIDVNGNYEPSNCRWADSYEQQSNKRGSRIYEFNGKKMGLSAWARETGIKRSTINGRLASGWSIEDALTIAPMR